MDEHFMTITLYMDENLITTTLYMDDNFIITTLYMDEKRASSFSQGMVMSGNQLKHAGYHE
jgi:hypothetical protein